MENERIMENFATIITLKKLGYEFRMNILDDSLEVNGERLTDALEARLRADLKRNDIKITRDELMVDLYDYALRNAYNPICEYFHALPKWDGQDHIGMLAARLTDAHEPITYSDGTVRTVIHAFLRRWLIGAVQRLHNHKTQNPVLVLAGGQGIGKSSLAEWLCPLPNHFYRGAIDPEAYETDMYMTQNFVWEIDELSSTTRRKDVDALKASLTKGITTYRQKYSRHSIQKPITASFIGTVNPDGLGFLRDSTGNRRYSTVELKSIDFSYEGLNRDQIYAQALSLFQDGETCNYSPEEKAVQAVNNEEHTHTPTVDEWLDECFLLDPTQTEWKLPSSEICNTLIDAGYKAANTKIITDEVAQCLKKRGHEKMGKPLTWRGIKHKDTTKVITFLKK